MRKLSQALSRSAAGQPLPDLFPKLTREQIVLRRGQVAMIAGQPGAGKSLLALHYAVHQNLPCLYFSADSDEATVAYRAGAMLTGQKVADVERQILNGGGAYYEDVLDRLDNVRFVFTPSPTLDDIAYELEAFAEVWGCDPDLIVVDNLMNVVAEHDNEFAGMRELAKALHHLARETRACVMVLHHTSEAAGSPVDPPARRDLHGKVSQLPELILTVALNSMSGEYRVACVKNRSGPFDATGRTYETLYADTSRMALFESYGEMTGTMAVSDWGVE
jgi:KaiC/GvpD/RAD55 family RecA-like ATPase